MKNIVIPDMGMSTAEVDIMKWKVKTGDFVKEGDPIVEIESEKANVVIESKFSGVITEILFKEGDSAPVGSTICKIDDNVI